VLVLAGCSGGPGSEMTQYLSLFRQSLGQSFGRSGVTREQAAAIPYASMGWRLNGGQQAIIVLATATGADMIWTSASKIVLQTSSGRLTRTVGLPVDIAGLAPRNGAALVPPSRALGGPYMEQRIVDFPGKGAFDVQITCRGQSRGQATIEILKHAIRAVRVDETCTSQTLGWSFVDSYWLDGESGLVWRSIQHIHPDAVVETELFRPPG
jgi:hypothetical protein